MFDKTKNILLKIWPNDNNKITVKFASGNAFLQGKFAFEENLKYKNFFVFNEAILILLKISYFHFSFRLASHLSTVT